MKKNNIIYILGYGHSGSTLLNLILGASENSFSVGELMFLRNRMLNLDNKFRKKSNLMCTCGKKFAECSFWNDISKYFKPEYLYEEKTSLKDYFSILLNNPIKENNYQDKELYLKLFEKTQSGFIIDSSKNLNRLRYIESSFNPKVIYLVRDGRGVINSMEKRGVFWLKTYFVWFGVNILMRKYIKQFSNKEVIEISYENFTQNPRKYLKQINLQFGTNIDLENYIDDVNKEQYHNFAGNGMRNKKLESIKYDQSWKKRMSKPKQVLLTILCYIPNRLWVYNEK